MINFTGNSSTSKAFAWEATMGVLRGADNRNPASDPSAHFRGVSGPSGPDIPRKSTQKSLFRSLQKKSPRRPGKVKNIWVFSGICFQKAADVWNFQARSQTFLVLRFSLGIEGKDGKHLSSQTWPGSPRHPSPRHLRPPDSCRPDGRAGLGHDLPFLDFGDFLG